MQKSSFKRIFSRSVAVTQIGFGCLGVMPHACYSQVPSTSTHTKKPNIIVIALDDVGFSDLGAYGSEIATPNIDSIAKTGLRYTNFQTKAICSPTRASLMTGRNPLTVGMADLPDLSRTPKQETLAKLTGVIPANAEMLPEALRRAGYATFAVGKWHLTPRYQTGEEGNNSTMPLQRDFDYFYGYKMGWTDQYHPELFEGNRPVPDPYRPGYFLAEDLATHAISVMRKSQETQPDKPMFLYLAFTFAHMPLQAPKSYIDHYKDTYQKGLGRDPRGAVRAREEVGSYFDRREAASA
jgi:arylsulfatase